MASILETRIYSEIKYIFKDAQARFVIGGKECDIWIPSLHLGIEVDGYYWHKNSIEKEEAKNKTIEENGGVLVRIREEGLIKISENDVLYSRLDCQKTIGLCT